MGRIQPDKIYSVAVEHHRFKVRAVRPSAVAGWWLCEGEKSGERAMLPEGVLDEADPREDKDED